MDRFDMQDRNTALKMLEIWYDAGRSYFTKYYTNDAHRFQLACKLRGLINHDRVLTGRSVCAL